MPDTPFVHLHLHSEYSLLDGACRAKAIPKRAKELGMSAVAITDHGNMHGAIEFYRACQDVGVKPIIGIEAYICEHDRREKRDAKAHTGHMVLLARNLAGYRNLLKLATIGSVDGFYYRPRIDHRDLAAHADGLIGLTACIGGEIPKLIRAGDLEQAKAICRQYQEWFGRDGFYLEVQDHNTPARLYYSDQPKVNAVLRDMGRELGIPLVATNDVHFMHREDYDAHEVLVCIGKQTTLEEHRAKEMIYSTEQYLKSGEEMARTFPEYRDAVENSAAIAELCNVEIELDNQRLPQYDVPPDHTPDSLLRQVCETKLALTYTDAEARARAEERLNYELDIIAQKDLSAYFLIVRDFLDWARTRDILVGIRGSGAGAIVSYLTDICALDPLTYGLWFERFVSVDRVSMPDIDCDFEDRRRAEVIEYVIDKYGKEHVAQVATFGTLQPRLAVRDAARAMGVPLPVADRVAKAIGMAKSIQTAIEDNPPIKEMYADDPTVRHLLDMAGKLQGLTRHCGTHACALVIAKERLVETAPLQRTADGIGVQTQWEYPMAEAAGLVKIDFLGLRTLTVLKDALTYIAQGHGVRYDLDTLPLDDKAAYDLIARGDTAGVFQLESVGMRNVVKQLRPDRITDIIAVVALYRPGPMAEIPRFIQCKHDPSTISYLHPSLEPILKETYGVLVYQEQVMAIGRDIAGLDMVASTNLLNALRKKQLDKMAKVEPVFIEGVKRTSGFSDEQAELMWDRLQEFAKYAFNKAHSACYAVVAYQTAFLKANYPVEFMTALLTSVGDEHDKVSLYVAESKKRGIDVLGPDVNASRGGFSIQAGKIRFGMSTIKGVGAGAVEAIVAMREADGPFADVFDFCTRVESTVCNRLALEALVKSGAMDSLPGARAQKLAVLDQAIEMGQSTQRDKAAGQISLFGDIASAAPAMAPQLPALEEYPSRQLLDMEREFLGLYISNHPLNEHCGALDEYRSARVEELAECRPEQEVIIGGMVVSAKPYTTKSGKQMGFVTLDDLTGSLEITVFPEAYEKYGRFLTADSIVLIKGTIDFGQSFKAQPALLNEDDEPERPEAKLLAIAIAPIDDAEAVLEMQRATPRKRFNPNANGNGYGKAPLPGPDLPVFRAAPGVREKYTPPAPRAQEDSMSQYTDADAPPPVKAPPATATSFRLRLTEAFVTTDDFDKLPGLLQSCKGDSPVEITVLATAGPRRFRVPNLCVNPDWAGRFVGVLPGAEVE
jgi:DNA polymerase-3 subunit alpha